MEPKIDTWKFLMMRQNNYRYLSDLQLDNKREARESRHRYFLDYWDMVGGPYRTDERIPEPVIPKPPPKIKVVNLGNLKWTREEALQYLEEKALGEILSAEIEAKTKKKAKGDLPKPRKERTIEEIYYADAKKPKDMRLERGAIEDLLSCVELQIKFQKYQAKYDEGSIMAEEAEVWEKLRREKQRRADKERDEQYFNRLVRRP
jgi:hypothetical protein